eukprot:4058112-Amphidinium_carterae.1
MQWLLSVALNVSVDMAIALGHERLVVGRLDWLAFNKLGVSANVPLHIRFPISSLLKRGWGLYTFADWTSRKSKD